MRHYGVTLKPLFIFLEFHIFINFLIHPKILYYEGVSFLVYLSKISACYFTFFRLRSFAHIKAIWHNYISLKEKEKEGQTTTVILSKMKISKRFFHVVITCYDFPIPGYFVKGTNLKIYQGIHKQKTCKSLWTKRPKHNILSLD